MSNVTLNIGGRAYTVACADGEEAHILGLGHAVDTRLASLPGAAGLGETRALLFAALVLADELQEARGPAAAPPAASAELEALASRLEHLAASLEAAA